MRQSSSTSDLSSGGPSAGASGGATSTGAAASEGAATSPATAAQDTAGPRGSRAGLFDGVLARGPVREAMSDVAWLQALLDVEAGLARAEARARLISAEQANAIGAACRVEGFDVSEIGALAADSGNPVVPLVAALRLAAGGSASEVVHWGATSQDVLDTAAMLLAKRATGLILEDLAAAGDAAAELAMTHRSTVMAGRTLLQQAAPITFGLKAAGWLVAIDEAAGRLDDVRRTRLAIQLGGAAGTLGPLGVHGLEVTRHLAAELDLAEPTVPWHAHRGRIGELAGALAMVAGAIGKCAIDVVLLAQTEVGEAREGVSGRGGSSTLPHKRNPIAAISALACARQAPGLAATLFGAAIQEQERGAGTWHAEWRPFTDLLVAVGSGAAWLHDCLAHLEVDEAAIRANLELTDGLLVAEQVTEALAPILGRAAARRIVEAACDEAIGSGRDLSDVLAEDRYLPPDLGPEAVAELFDPAGALGSTDGFIDRALEAHRGRRGGRSEPSKVEQ